MKNHNYTKKDEKCLFDSYIFQKDVVFRISLNPPGKRMKTMSKSKSKSKRVEINEG
jgi:hypothetical protein